MIVCPFSVSLGDMKSFNSIFDQWPKAYIGLDVQPEIHILKVIYLHTIPNLPTATPLTYATDFLLPQVLKNGEKSKNRSLHQNYESQVTFLYLDSYNFNYMATYLLG